MNKTIFLIFAIHSMVNGYGQIFQDYFNHGNAKLDIQDYKGAVEDDNKAIRMNPKIAVIIKKGITSRCDRTTL